MSDGQPTGDRTACGVMLSARPFGEGKAVPQALTEVQCRHAGPVRGVRQRGEARQSSTVAMWSCSLML